jgi:hypothetical protein
VTRFDSIRLIYCTLMFVISSFRFFFSFFLVEVSEALSSYVISLVQVSEALSSYVISLVEVSEALSSYVISLVEVSEALSCMLFHSLKCPKHCLRMLFHSLKCPKHCLCMLFISLDFILFYVSFISVLNYRHSTLARVTLGMTRRSGMTRQRRRAQSAAGRERQHVANLMAILRNLRMQTGLQTMEKGGFRRSTKGG